MKQEVLFVILNEYADWEGAFIAACLNRSINAGQRSDVYTEVVAPTLDAVRSIGGFCTRYPIIASRRCPQIMRH